MPSLPIEIANVNSCRTIIESKYGTGYLQMHILEMRRNLSSSQLEKRHILCNMIHVSNQNGLNVKLSSTRAVPFKMRIGVSIPACTQFGASGEFWVNYS